MDIEKLVGNIPKIKPKHKTTLIGIDGRGGSGKTTLALLIKKHFPETRIVTTDDFYNKEIEKIDERLLEDKILKPISQDLPATYVEFNGIERKLRTIEPGGILIIEGVYSIHGSISHYYDYKIWIEASVEDINKRVLKRDSYFDQDWDKFHRSNEDKYIKENNPKKRADLVIENDLRTAIGRKNLSHDRSKD